MGARLKRFFLGGATGEEQRLRMALMRATQKRYGISMTHAFRMVDELEIELHPVEEGGAIVESRSVFDLAETGMMTKELEAGFFGLVVDLIGAFLEALPEMSTIRLIFDGTIPDQKGWEHKTSILSVEATRDVAASLNWENLDDRHILEHFDFRYARGKPILAHGDKQAVDPGVAADLMALTPEEFELRVVDLFTAMGFVVEHTGQSGDHGVDLVATSTAPVTGGRFIIQCKRYAERNNVGESEVRDLYGAVTHERANKGILVTTSDFTPAARRFATDKQIELIDGHELDKLVEKHPQKAKAEGHDNPRSEQQPNNRLKRVSSNLGGGVKRIEHTHMHGHSHRRTGRIHDPWTQTPHEHGHKRQYGRYSNLTGTGGAYGSYRMFHDHPHSHPLSGVEEKGAVGTKPGQASCLSLLVVLPLVLLAYIARKL